ncbi:hypothetical protein BDD12DRAFT_810401 [Trichophaea hybrida]|nr:hypothetical protein BDD12DRAFT_810401 [Trichophaea hybrida]
MNFVFNIGDIIAISQIAITVYQSCKDAPRDFQLLSEVSNLHTVLTETKVLVEEEALTPERTKKLEEIIVGCNSVLTDLQELLGKFDCLGSKSRRNFDRLRWSKDEASALRDRIVSNTSLLTAFNSSVQL